MEQEKITVLGARVHNLKNIDVEIEAKATSIPQVHAQKQAGKVIKDGQLYIERNGELFDVTGARVK